MTPQQHKLRIKAEEYLIGADDIVTVARRETPERLVSYFVEIEGRRFPPKQLVRGATHTTQAFDTGVAIRALKALGFDAVRLAEKPQS